MRLKTIHLKPKKEDSLLRFHPWIFSGAIAYQDDNIDEGDVVEVYTSNDKYNRNGTLPTRVYHG